METDTQQFIVQQNSTQSQSNVNYYLPNYLYETNENKGSEIVMFGIQEEPIDLTFSTNKEEIITFPPSALEEQSLQHFQKYSENTNVQQTGNVYYFPDPKNMPRRKRTKKNNLLTTADGNMLLVNDILLSTENPANSSSVQEPKFQEILRAAKSLFSKRTRTLYHWMHPNASKQQIKFVVANSWESLQPNEKEFYVAQVMERFGYTQGNLMVNPQLNNIKDLAVIPPNFENVNSKTTELQNAISSIACGESGTSALSLGATGSSTSAVTSYNENFNASAAQRVKKRSKPSRSGTGTTNKRKKKLDSIEFIDVCNDFQDDPELSQELAQFASIIKNKI